LIFNEKESKRVRASMGTGMTDIQKFQDMCAYQFEMRYDLGISPGCNVSESPGFESVLGIYGGQHEIIVCKQNEIVFSRNTNELFSHDTIVRTN
jgi:hypothetical protein